MVIMGIVLIIAITIIVIVLIMALSSPQGYKDNQKTPFDAWCDAWKHISDNKKEIEFRRLEVLEKTPELRQLIFHPKMIEGSKKG